LLQEKSMWQATLEIIKTGGPFALLAGLGPTFIGYLIEGGVKFGVYEVSKPVTQRFLSSVASFFSYPALDSRILSLMICGFISGTAASMMLSPMEALRIRMVSEEEFSDKNLFDAGATMMKKEGIQSLLKGLPAMFWKQGRVLSSSLKSFDCSNRYLLTPCFIPTSSLYYHKECII
jgi:solute carrier family 25 phosphate transporter 3